MENGIYLNSFICIILSLFSGYIFYFIYKKNKNNFLDLSFSIFWLLAGITWLFFAISMLLIRQGYIEISLFLNQYIVQTAGFLQGVFVSYFVLFRLLKNKIIALSFLAFSLVTTAIALFLNYQKGSISLTKITNYSFEYDINDISLLLFKILFAIIFIMLLLVLFRDIFYWFKKNKLFEQKYFFATTALFFYLMMGYFEETGSYVTWISMLFRAVSILSLYIVYISYKEKEEL